MKMPFRQFLIISAAFSVSLGLTAMAVPQLDPEDPLADLAEPPLNDETGIETLLPDDVLPAIDPETGLPVTDPLAEGEFDDINGEEQIQFPRIAPIFAPDYDQEDYIIRPESHDEELDDVDPFADIDEREATSDAENALEDDDTEVDAELQDLEYSKKPAVMLRGLDKISGRSTDIELAVDQNVLFGGLRVTVKACHQTPPTEPPESVAYIEVEDYGFELQDDPELPEEIDLERRVFNGWMFASSPGLNGLEHPIYDVWVIRCMAEAPVLSEEGSES